MYTYFISRSLDSDITNITLLFLHYGTNFDFVQHDYELQFTIIKIITIIKILHNLYIVYHFFTAINEINECALNNIMRPLSQF